MKGFVVTSDRNKETLKAEKGSSVAEILFGCFCSVDDVLLKHIIFQMRIYTYITNAKAHHQ